MYMKVVAYPIKAQGAAPKLTHWCYDVHATIANTPLGNTKPLGHVSRTHGKKFQNDTRDTERTTSAPATRMPRVAAQKRIRPARVPSLKNFDPDFFKSAVQVSPAQQWIMMVVEELDRIDAEKREMRDALHAEMLRDAKSKLIEIQILEQHDMEMELDKITAAVSQAHARQLAAFAEKCYSKTK